MNRILLITLFSSFAYGTSLQVLEEQRLNKSSEISLLAEQIATKDEFIKKAIALWRSLIDPLLQKKRAAYLKSNGKDPSDKEISLMLEEIRGPLNTMTLVIEAIENGTDYPEGILEPEIYDPNQGLLSARFLLFRVGMESAYLMLLLKKYQKSLHELMKINKEIYERQS